MAWLNDKLTIQIVLVVDSSSLLRGIPDDRLKLDFALARGSACVGLVGGGE